MGINLYRRHRSTCKSGLPHNQRSGEFEERKKGWKRCDCPIVASGTLHGEFKRKSTETWDWVAAKAVASRWESNDSWSGHPASVPISPPTPAPTTSPTPEPGVKISKAIADYLADHKGDSANSTTRMYGYLLKDFAAYSEELGYIWLNQWRLEDVRAFRKRWKVVASTARKNLSNLKAFFEFCVENKWIPFNPARFKARHTRKERDDTERIPFSDEDVERMFRACAEQYGQSQYKYRYVWTGQDLSDFVAVSIYTGLRISDVATFSATRLKPNGDCLIRTIKNHKEVCVWIPIWLQDRIHERKKKFGNLIFGEHETENIESITDQWRRRLNKLWDLCGPWSHPPVHHRFRHTFARILLQQNNVTVRDLAELLGDTEETVLKYYGAWVPERQERVTDVVKKAFEGKPTPMPMKLQGNSVQSP